LVLEQKFSVTPPFSVPSSSRQQIISSLLSQYPPPLSSAPSSPQPPSSSSSSRDLILFFPRVNPKKHLNSEIEVTERQMKFEIEANLNTDLLVDYDAGSVDPWFALSEEDTEHENTKLKIELIQVKKEKDLLTIKLEDSDKALENYRDVVTALVANQGTILPFPLHINSPYSDYELAEWYCKLEQQRDVRLKNEILFKLNQTNSLLKKRPNHKESSNESLQLSQINRALKHENFKLRAFKIQHDILKQEDLAKTQDIETLKKKAS